MTATVHPIAGPTFNGRALRQTASVNKGGCTSARPLGCLTGVRPGTPDSTVTATSVDWYVNAVAGSMDRQVAAECGGYDFAIDAQITGKMVAANGTMPRRDTVILTVNDPPEDQTATPGIVATVIAGSPATTNPVAPPVPARSMLLGYLAVPKSGGGAPTFIPAWGFAVAAGAILPVRDLAARDALAKYPSLTVYRFDINQTETWNGAGWASIGAGAMYGTEYDPGQATTNTVGYNVDTLIGTGVTFTLSQQRRVRIVTRARFFASAAGQVVYVRSHVIAGATAVVAGSTPLGTESQTLTPGAATAFGTGVTATHEHTAILTPGTYTAFPVGGSTTGASSSFGAPYTAVYDAGPA